MVSVAFMLLPRGFSFVDITLISSCPVDHVPDVLRMLITLVNICLSWLCH